MLPLIVLTVGAVYLLITDQFNGTATTNVLLSAIFVAVYDIMIEVREKKPKVVRHQSNQAFDFISREELARKGAKMVRSK